MHMIDAMNKSKYGEAKRPYYRDERQMKDPSMGKFLVVRGRYFFVTWADTGAFIREANGDEIMTKASGMNDWEPLDPKTDSANEGANGDDQ